MNSILIGNIAWALGYDGIEPGSVQTFAQWEGDKDLRNYAELWNFSPFNGRVYGYVPCPPYWTIRVENVGARSGGSVADGVTVVFTAPHPVMRKRVIVGWYRNAVVHRKFKNRPGGLPKEYFMEAACEDAVLVPAADRSFVIDKRFRYFWYAKDDPSAAGQIFQYVHKSSAS